MKILSALFTFLIVASGLPVCRCADHGGESCRTVGGGETAADDTAPRTGCCSGESTSAPPSDGYEGGGGGGGGGGCCCADAPPADPTVKPPSALTATGTSVAHPAAAPPFIAPAPHSAPLGLDAAAARDADHARRATIRSAPSVPLYRLHAALLI